LIFNQSTHAHMHTLHRGSNVQEKSH